MFPILNFKNIFPILGDGIMPPIKGSIVPGGWFTEFFLMTFFLPFLADKKKGMKYGMLTVFACDDHVSCGKSCRSFCTRNNDTTLRFIL